MNENVTKYQQELFRGAQTSIANLRSLAVSGITPERQQIDAEIIETIIPIAKRYRSELGAETTNLYLEQVTKKIREAFVPKAEKIAKEKVEVKKESRPLYFSPRLEKLVDERDFLSSASTKLKEIAENITSFNEVELIVELAPFLDLLDSSEFEIRSDLKELALLIRQIMISDEDPTLENVFADEPEKIAVLGGRPNNPALPILVNFFIGNLPKFNNRASVAKACREAIIKTSVKEKEQTKLISLIEQNIPLLKEREGVLNASLNELEGEFKTKGFEKQKIELEDQKKSFEMIVKKSSSVKGPLEEKRRKNDDKKDNLNLIIDLLKRFRDGVIDQTELNKKFGRLSAYFDDFGLDPRASIAQLEQETSAILIDLNAFENLYDFLNAELDEIIDDFIKEWGLKPYSKEVAEKEIDQMTVGEIIQEIIDKEVAFWTNLHETSPDERIRKLVYRVKYNLGGKGKGYESVGSRNGTENDYWASLEGRENMVRLQMYAVFAKTLHGKSYAEGDRTKTFESIDSVKLTRPELILGTTAHPVYGKLLAKVLELSQDLPILKTGGLPPENLWDELSKNNPTIKKRLETAREKIRKGERAVLHDRVVMRPVGGGKFERVFLAGDVWINIENDETKQVERRTFSPGEEMLPGDKLYLEADGRYTYESLCSSDGRKTAMLLHQTAMDDIIANPERYGLKKSDVEISEEYKGRVQELSTYMYYAFPFLTYTFHKCQERTKTAAHGKHLHDEVDLGLAFSPAGKAIHESDRYGDFVSWMWLLVFYKELKPGMFGASGNPNRLNKFRKVLVSYLRATFGDSVDDYVGKIDILEHLLPEFTSPLRWVMLAPEECVALKGDSGPVDFSPDVHVDADIDEKRLVDKDGTKIHGTNEKPYYLNADGEHTDKSKNKQQMATTFDLLHVAIKGWVELLASTVREVPAGSVNKDNLKTRGDKKGLFGDVIANISGTLKMWFTRAASLKNTTSENHNVMEGAAKYFVLHYLDKMFYSYDSFNFGDRKEGKDIVIDQIEAATGIKEDFGVGGTGAGEVKQLWLWVLNKVKGIKSVKENGEVVRDDVLYKPHLPPFEKAKMTILGAKMNANEIGFRAAFAPPEFVGGSYNQKHILEHLNIYFDYEHGEDPVYAQIGEPMTNNPATGYLSVKAWALRDNPVVGRVLRELSEMAVHPQKIDIPLPRTGIKTDSSASDKK